MTIKISIEGADVKEVLAQMLSILNVPTPGVTPPVAKTNGNGLDKPKEAVQATPAPGKKPVGRPPKGVTVLSNEKPPAEPADADEQISPPDDPDPVVAGPEKSAADIRHDAVLVLKKVYTKGAVGQAKVDEICKHFNVTKLVDIPLDRAIELLQMSNRALLALGG